MTLATICCSVAEEDGGRHEAGSREENDDDDDDDDKCKVFSLSLHASSSYTLFPFLPKKPPPITLIHCIEGFVWKNSVACLKRLKK